jgi:hypothetical protein
VDTGSRIEPQADGEDQVNSDKSDQHDWSTLSV